MKITLIYDNDVYEKDLKSDWGFSCLIEGVDMPTILFDTGANGALLLGNMEKLNIDPLSIDMVFISHAHWDHTGGLSGFLNKNGEVKIFIPVSCPVLSGAKEVVRVEEPLEICNGVFSTGELKGIEQSLAVKTESGLTVIVGCSHPGVEDILRSASQFGPLYALVGGLHGFSQFDKIKELGLVCPCHCTQFKSVIRSLYPEKYIDGGAGKILNIA
jgi:7,8-dihydropterin-6-yl-methyl-4-(beta-D-ribofuranosyl)aminobenzene 5'-phosphate synthase